MTGLELPLALFLLVNLVAALLFGTTGVGILLLLAHAGGGPALVDGALVLALLAAIAGVAFARHGWIPRGDDHDRRA